MAQLYFEDVSVGDKLTLSRELTIKTMVMAASATRDWQPHHHDREYCQEVLKTRDMFVNTQFNMGMMCRAITDWAGPKAFITKLGINMRDQVCVGDTMTISGTVIGKRAEGGKSFVDIDLVVSNGLGPTTLSNVTVTLPSRT